MNCLDFEVIVNDLARDRMIDASTRDRSLAHAESCARCVARLADERTLTAGLRAMSARDANIGAPARAEAALLTAFRERMSGNPLTPAAIPTSRGMRRRWHRSIGSAAAATLLLIITLFILRWQHPAPPKLALEVSRTPPVSATPSPVAAEPAPRPMVVRNDHRPRAPYRRTLQSSANSAQMPVAGMTPRITPKEAPPALNVASNASGAEIATDFLPLSDESGGAPLDSGRVVRVELPRSALVSMGLPVNMEHTGELVKADVLLGEDGVARAIRFVR